MSAQRWDESKGESEGSALQSLRLPLTSVLQPNTALPSASSLAFASFAQSGMKYNEAHTEQHKFKCTQKINNQHKCVFPHFSWLKKSGQTARESVDINEDPDSGRCGPGLDRGFSFANKAPGVNMIQQRQTALVSHLRSFQPLNLCSILQCG